MQDQLPFRALERVVASNTAGHPAQRIAHSFDSRIGWKQLFVDNRYEIDKTTRHPWPELFHQFTATAEK